MRRTTLGFFFGWATLGACGDDGGPTALTPTTDVAFDSATSTSDTSAGSDALTSNDTASTTPGDTTVPGPDFSGPVTCPDVQASRAGVTFTSVPRTFPPPTLIGDIQGASRPTGAWNLADITIFQNGTFVDWVTVAFTNAGDTRGAAAFDAGGVFAVDMRLDMNIAVTVGENFGEDRATSDIGLGGPIVFDAGWLRGALDRCGDGIGAGRSHPEAIAYDHDGTKLRLAVVVSREDLIELLPEDQRANAEYVVTGPMTVVARFER
jgi:hypothetical protein